MSSASPPSGAIDDILRRYDARRDPFDFAAGEGLPPADADLASLAAETVCDPDDDPAFKPPFRSSFHRKTHALRRELTGQSALCVLHGQLVACLRKRSFPDHAPALFQRLWAEQADHLLAQLDARWLVSAVTTFGDQGLTPAQRATGQALTAFFGAMKLYESERLYSGHAPEEAFGLGGKVRAPLPLDMDAYALVNGGLDVNLVARLWQTADADAIIAPLAHRLLRLLLADDRSILARLRHMKAAKFRARESTADEAAPALAASPPQDAQPMPATAPVNNAAPVPASAQGLTAQSLRWGLVSTIKAPLREAARFAAHHLEMGCDGLHVFLDDADAEVAAFLRRHPRIQVTLCDDAYWAQSGRPRMDEHQLRQVFNATRTYRAVGAELHWLGHLDVDEFLLCDRPLNALLAGISSEAALVRIPPAEALAPVDGGPVRHFKLTHLQAGVRKAEVQDVYPTFGLHLYGGFLSHTSGKVFARTGIPDTRLGIHSLKYRGTDAANRVKPAGLLVAHLHAASWDAFRGHLAFRRTRGSYRPRADRPELGQAALLDYLETHEGDAGLRAFFDEVCADTPELRARLAEKGMLVTHDLDLDATVRRVFGVLP